MTIYAHIHRLVVLILLSAPLFLGFFGMWGKDTPPAPSLASPAAYTAWYGANFPLRQAMVRTNNILRLALLGESAVAGVVVGSHGWLFYNLEWAMEDYENVSTFSEADLELMVRHVRQRRDWLAARGIDYIVAVAPNKETMYGEYLPPAIRKLGSVSRLDRLADRMAQEEVTFLDLRGPLRAAAAQHRTYAKTDTHWNDWGGFVGSREIVEAVRRRRPQVPPLRAEDYRLVERRAPGGDLAAMMLLKDHIPEPEVALEPLTPNRARAVAARGYPDPADHPSRAMVVMETGDTRLPRAMIFRDSFAWGLIPFLSERFQSSVYLWDHQFLPDLIEAEAPDVVIHVMVERYQHALFIENPPQVRAASR